MKAIIYCGILPVPGLTVSDKLVYSQILFRSLWDNGRETFDTDGNFAPETYIDGFVPVGNTVTSSIASSLNISSRQYFLSVKKLTAMGYINTVGDSKYIKMDSNLNSSFFRLYPESGLRGLELIVYSYIVYKCKKYKVVDKYHKSMGEELGLSRSHLEQILSELSGRGERLALIAVKPRGRQRLLFPIPKKWL